MTKSNPSQNPSNSNVESSEKSKSDVERSQTPSIQKSESGDSSQDFDEEVWGSIDDENKQSDSNRKNLDGWDEEWNEGDVNSDDNEPKNEDEKVKTSNSVKPNDDDFFEKFTNESTNSKTSSSKNWTKSDVKKSVSFDNDYTLHRQTDVTSTVSYASNDDKQQRLEQRRQTRNKENEERKTKKTTKGPMKLGAQKLA